MKLSPTTKARRLIQAVDNVLMCLDDERFFKGTVPDETIDVFYEVDDDGKIGGENRKRLAALIRNLRKSYTFRKQFRASIKDVLKRMTKNPKRYRVSDPRNFRFYPHTVTRKARPAKTHRDCSYCGTGYSGQVCGVCREAGIDGPVILGTQSIKETTYVEWRKRS